MKALSVTVAFIVAVAVATLLVVGLMFRDATAFAAFPLAFLFALPFSTVGLAPALFVLSKFKFKSLLPHVLVGGFFGAFLALMTVKALPKLNQDSTTSIATFGVVSMSSLYLVVGGMVAATVFWVLLREKKAR